MPSPPGPGEDTEAFGRLVARRDPPLDLTLAELAAVGRPGVDAGRTVGRLDELAGACRGDDAVSVCASLFGELGFRGDVAGYHDPRNSLLDQVLVRRLGMPITLSVVALEVARRRGVGLVGVGMPGHFLVRDAADPGRFLDPFDRGRELDRAGCVERFRAVQGTAVPFDDRYLDPTPPVQVVLRVLANLSHSYALLGDRRGILRVARLQALVPAAGLEGRRRLAEALAAAGRFDEAASLLEELATEDPGRAPEHERAARRLRAGMN